MSDSKANPPGDDKMGRESPPDPTWPTCLIQACGRPVTLESLASRIELPLCEAHSDLERAVAANGVTTNETQRVIKALAERLLSLRDKHPASPVQECPVLALQAALEMAARMTTRTWWSLHASLGPAETASMIDAIRTSRWTMGQGIEHVRAAMKPHGRVAKGEAIRRAIMVFWKGGRGRLGGNVENELRDLLGAERIIRKAPGGRPAGAKSRKGEGGANRTPGTRVAMNAAIADLLGVTADKVRGVMQKRAG